MAQLSRESVVQHSQAAIAAEVGSEVVLMNLGRGRCYGLGQVGTDVWKKLARPIAVGDLIADVLATLEQYASEGLIVVQNHGS
jgi:hypothetical protein